MHLTVRQIKEGTFKGWWQVMAYSGILLDWVPLGLSGHLFFSRWAAVKQMKLRRKELKNASQER